MRVGPALLAAALIGCCSASAVTRQVTSAAEFNALPALEAGDLVILRNGTYGSLNKTIVSNIADDTTAQSNPVRILAETNGGVIIDAPSRLTLQGRGIVLAGLDFAAGSGMLDNASTDPAWLIRTAANSRFITLSNLRFLNANAGDDYGNWLFIDGFYHRIEYCTFTGKNSRNATIALKRNTAEAGIATPRGHRLRYCYFGPRECSATDNGYESIRIGDSSSQAHDMQVTVERNVFFRAIWRSDTQKPNDLEIISNKSRGNRILHNTFLESYGQITLRHGDACLVEGNYVFGSGYYADDGSIALRPANGYQGGIRVIGQDHVVRNNYLINLSGTNLRAALCLMGGESTFVDGNGSGGSSGYEAAHNALIHHNTFVDCRQINLGYLNGGTVIPTGVRLYNNAWQASGTSDGIVRSNNFTPAASGGNYLYHPAGNTGWNGLGGTYSSTTSPAIAESFEDHLIPTASSPLLGAADPTQTAEEDLRNLPRPASGQAIGASERPSDDLGLRPLRRHEVGPEFDGGPADTFPSPRPAPSTQLDLRRWNITLPVDANGGTDGEAITIPTATLTSGYAQRPWFFSPRDGAVVFSVPPVGAITGTSTHSRSELRECNLDGTILNWTPASLGGTHRLTATCSVADFGPGHVAIGQIHGKEPNIPAVILRYDATTNPARVTATVKHYPVDDSTQDTFVFTQNIGPNLPIAYEFTLWGSGSDASLGITVNGQTAITSLTARDPAWTGVTFYFKAGAYYTRPQPNRDVAVTFTQLDVQHFTATAPSLTTQPADVSATAGTNVTLALAAAGTGPLSCQWFHQGNVLPGATNPSLTLSAITAADTGDYYAVVTGPGGFVTSRTATLTLRPDFATWSATHNLTGIPADADTDGDGLPNLLEYALATDPRHATDTGPQLATAEEAGATYLTLTFTRIADPSLTYVVQASTTLTADSWLDLWSSSGSANTSGTVSVRDSSPLTASTPRFLRLLVRRQS